MKYSRISISRSCGDYFLQVQITQSANSPTPNYGWRKQSKCIFYSERRFEFRRVWDIERRLYFGGSIWDSESIFGMRKNLMKLQCLNGFMSRSSYNVKFICWTVTYGDISFHKHIYNFCQKCHYIPIGRKSNKQTCHSVNPFSIMYMYVYFNTFKNVFNIL